MAIYFTSLSEFSNYVGIIFTRSRYAFFAHCNTGLLVVGKTIGALA